MEEEDNIQNQDDFVKEVKTVFSNKSKAVDAEWKIKTFKQEKKTYNRLLIEFKTLAMKN